MIEYYEMSTVYTRGMETTRSIIWEAYFDNLNFFNTIFGMNTDNLPVLKEWGGVPHNSFLSFHRRMGLLGVGALFFFILKSFRVLLKKKQFFYLFFDVVLLLRMYFDGMLTTAEDFFILTLLFIPLFYNSDTFQIEKQLEKQSDHWIERLWDRFVVFI